MSDLLCRSAYAGQNARISAKNFKTKVFKNQSESKVFKKSKIRRKWQSMYHAITSGAFHGMDSFLVQVEVDVSNGIPCMEMVGCLAGEVKETRERVRVGIKNSGFDMPVKRITVSLSPADVRKDGSAFDLPVALGILGAVNLQDETGSREETGQKNTARSTDSIVEKPAQEGDREEREGQKTAGPIILGELGLDGTVKGVRGILPILLQAEKEKITSCIIPYENRLEASNVRGIQIYPVKTLQEAYQIYGALHDEKTTCDIKKRKGNKKEKDAAKELKYVEILRHAVYQREENQQEKGDCDGRDYGTRAYDGKVSEMREGRTAEPDFSQVCGQEHAKRAAMIAAAGFHNLLLFGPPGSGKSMIAERIPGIMPDMSYEECMEVTKIYSVAGLLGDKTTLVTKRPFLSPHHTVTDAALVGGGSVPRPGIITLSHKGILFMDELPEFGRGRLDLLRQPLEEKKVQISRMLYSCDYQADFMLVAAMNPCPCGFYPDRNKCSCKPYQIEKYLGQISGPFLDRIDLSVEVGAMKWEQTMAGRPALGASGQQERGGSVWDSSAMKQMTEAAIRRQMDRSGKYNSALTGEEIERDCRMTGEAEGFLKCAFGKLGLSMRSLLRLKRVARTIADLEGTDEITQAHIAEAIMLNKGLERLKRKKVEI